MSDPQTPQALILSSTSLGPILGNATSRTARLGDFQTLLPVMALPVFFSNSLTTYPGFGSHLASSMSARMRNLLPPSTSVGLLPRIADYFALFTTNMGTAQDGS